MAKGIERRDFKDDELERLALLAAAADDPIPHSPRWFRALLRAYEARLARADPKAAKFGKIVGQYLAATERMTAMLDSAIGGRLAPDVSEQTVCLPLLKELAEGDLARVRHVAGIIESQRALLAHYLAVYPYPIDTKATRAKDRRWLWVKEHWKPILRLIGPLPCMCEYNRFLGKRYEVYDEHKAPCNELNSVTVAACSSGRAILAAILAHLHTTTPNEIEKLVKPSSR